MDISNIIYYGRNGDESITLSLRDLCLRDEYDLENVFYVARDAQDSAELLCGLRRICCDYMELECETSRYIRFTVIDVYGNTNYLKFRKRREK